MKTVTYKLLDGSDYTVEYDENEPCWMCGEPVGEASMGGTVICPDCDCGYTHDGRKWTIGEAMEAARRFKEKREAVLNGS